MPFKELADRIEKVTPLPYHGKLCIISDITKGNLITGYRISILDKKTSRELQSFNQMYDQNYTPWGDLQCVNDRYIMQTCSARHWTSVSLIDLKKQKITYGIESDPKELISGFVQNGNVMLLQEDGLRNYPLKQ